MSENDIKTRKRNAEIEKENGNKYFKSGHYDSAIKHYTKAIDYDSSNAVLYVNRAMAYHKKGLPFESERDCDSALSIDPNYVKGYYRRSLVRKQLYRYKSAFNDITEVLRFEPNNKEAQNEHKLLSQILNSNETIEIKPIEKPIVFRSKKPLTKVPIINIGDVKINEKYIQLPSSAPQTYYRFECDWRELMGHNANQLRLKYLQMIGVDKLSKLFTASLEPQIMSDIVCSAVNCHDIMFLFELLSLLTRVTRFSTLVLFLSENDNKMLRVSFERLSKSGEFMSEKVKELSNKWMISL